MSLTGTLGSFIAGMEYGKLGEEVVSIARERVVDTIGAALTGRATWGYCEALLSSFPYERGGDVPVICGAGRRYSAAKAVLLNVAFTHAAELDDGHRRAGVHAGTVVVPTAITLGALLGRNGKEILTAIVIGYEIVYRLAVAMSPWLIDKGFHPTSVCGTLGAAAVAAKLLGLDAERTAEALGLAGLFTGGLMEATISGQESKCVMVGRAAESGLEAAYMARCGIPGAEGVFEGPAGIFFAMGREVDADAMVSTLGREYLIGETYSKFYPTCRHSQPAIEAVLELATENGFLGEDVDTIDIGTYRVAYDLTGRIHRPRSPGEAKFSIPYGVAVAAFDRCFAVRHLTEGAYTSARFLDVADRVAVHIDDDVEGQYPKRRGAVASVKLKDGRSLVRECFNLRGSPAKPVTFVEIENKFRENASSCFGSDVVTELIGDLARLDEIGDISHLVEKMG